MDRTILENYAALIARMGVNVRPGQDVVVEAELDQPDFVTTLAAACYDAGARKVSVEWTHQPLSKLAALRQTPDVLGATEEWEKARLEHYAQTLPCRIYLLSDDPDGMNGVDPGKLGAAAQARRRAAKPYRDRMENRIAWCIAAVPGRAWAEKLFPGRADAEEALWRAILSASRALDGDPLAAWRAHNDDLRARCAHLNALGIRSLRYRAGNGTDLTVGMIPDAQFCGGEETSLSGQRFNPNIPSEEVFISPMRGEAEGVVYASMPLSYQGQLIEDFSVRFEGGRAVELRARKNEALLRSLAAMDEGAAYLGECALVPYDSPIRAQELLYYNTLFDENAACHLALGMGFPDTIRGFEKLTLQECRDKGVNDSVLHEDFMIGTRDLDIDGILADGRTVPIFRGGNWAF